MTLQSVQPKKIYIRVPDHTPWTPGANTVAYYPLTSTSTVNDLSGNGHTLTQVGGSFGTYAGVDCFNSQSGDNYMKGNIGDITQYSHTISIWAYKTGGALNYNVYQWGRGDSSHKGGTEGLQWQSYIRSFYWFDDLDTAGIYGTNARHNIITEFDKSNSKQIMYIDGVKIGERVTTYTHGPLYYTNDFYFFGGLQSTTSYSAADKMDGHISNFIIEDKVWTAEEVGFYYNDTKGDYGIS